MPEESRTGTGAQFQIDGMKTPVGKGRIEDFADRREARFAMAAQQGFIAEYITAFDVANRLKCVGERVRYIASGGGGS